MSIAEEVKQKLDIVEVVSEHTQLHKSGKNFRGLCPFHAEKDPSFYVFPDRGGWYCFGRCNTGGDIFAFVMKRENIPFVEALHALAERAGVTLRPRPQAEAQAREKEELHRLNEAAADYYHNLLVRSPAGEAAREYLKKRGVSIETVLNFKLGYAPAPHHSLHPHLEELGFSREAVMLAGLARQSDDGSLHDLFRNRLVFPIRDASGRLAGFGGRTLEDATPKYLNSPATPVFDKRSLLYGLDRAREAIRRQNRAVIVEGYMDTIIAHQAGYMETVATMGVALTQNHIQALRRMTRNLILAMDADTAGVEATLKGMEATMKGAEKTAANLDEEGVPWQGVIQYCEGTDRDIRVAPLPDGKDPDEVILQDPRNWQAILESARPTIDFVLDYFKAHLDVSEYEGQTALIDKVRPVFDAIRDPVRWGHEYQKLFRLGFSQGLLSRVLQFRKQPDWRGRRGDSAADLPRPIHEEERCLSLCLNFPELKGAAAGLPAELFEDSLNRELFLRWLETPDVASLREEMEEPLREHLDSVLTHPLAPLSAEKRQAAFQQVRLRLQERHLRQALAARRDALSQITAAPTTVAPEAGPPEATPDVLAPLEEKDASIQLKQVFQERRSLSRKPTP